MNKYELKHTKNVIATICAVHDEQKLNANDLLELLKFGESFFNSYRNDMVTIEKLADFTYDLMELVLSKLNVRWPNYQKVDFVKMAVNS